MRARGSSASTGGTSDGNRALRHQDQQDGLELLADLEGGSGGVGRAAGAVPFLMVGTKEETGEGVRRDGAKLAAELGVGHVTVVSSHLRRGDDFITYCCTSCQLRML